MTRFIVLSLLLFSSTIAYGRERSYAAELSLLGRDIQLKQTQFVSGRSVKNSDISGMIIKMEALIRKLDPDALASRSISRSLAIFVYSGGSASIVNSRISGVALPEPEGAIIRGGIAFQNGNRKLAREVLSGLDPFDLPRSLAGYVAVTLAMLVDGNGASKKLYLNKAGILTSGGLPEEFALRQKIRIANPVDQSEMISIIDRYYRRFPRSPYSKELKAQIQESVVAALAGGEEHVRASAYGIMRKMDHLTRSALVKRINLRVISEVKRDHGAGLLRWMKMRSISEKQIDYFQMYDAADRLIQGNASSAIFKLSLVEPRNLLPVDVQLYNVLRTLTELSSLRSFNKQLGRPDISSNETDDKIDRVTKILRGVND